MSGQKPRHFMISMTKKSRAICPGFEVVDGEGFEPIWCMTEKFPDNMPGVKVVDGEGFEPIWCMTEKFPGTLPGKVVDGEGFEPSKASPADLQSVPFGHSGIHP